MTSNSFLNEAIYLDQNPQVAEAVAQGLYASGLEEYVQIGQFQQRNGVIFNGTTGDDIIHSSGQTSSIFGVPVQSITSGRRLVNAQVESFGVGEFDTLLGSPGRNIFYLGDNAEENPQDFYLGEGDRDYALIRFFDPFSEDAIYLAGNPEDYDFETIDNSVHISKNGDLIGIIEDVPQLIPDGLFTSNGILLFAPENSFYASRSKPYFNETAYLAANPDVEALLDAGDYNSGWDHFLAAGINEERLTFFNGVVGRDSFFYALGNAVIAGMPITSYDPSTQVITTATTGSGDYDHFHGAFGVNRILLGNDGTDFYVGQGDQDYALIGDFDPKEDQLIMAKSIENYQFENIEVEFGGETFTLLQISTLSGDVIAQLEDPDLTFIQTPSDIAGTYALISPQNETVPLPDTEPIPTDSNIVAGSSEADDLFASITPGFDGVSDMVFAGAGNDDVDTAIAGHTAGDNRISLGSGDDIIFVTDRDRAFGGAGDDIFEATEASRYRLSGGAGHDQFFLGSNGRALGGDGDDSFFAEIGGDNKLSGGAGSDAFWIVNGELPEGTNTIVDFEQGLDIIGISGQGDLKFDGLALTVTGDDTEIGIGGTTIARLMGTTSLNADDFTFAA